MQDCPKASCPKTQGSSFASCDEALFDEEECICNRGRLKVILLLILKNAVINWVSCKELLYSIYCIKLATIFAVVCTEGRHQRCVHHLAPSQCQAKLGS